MPYESRHLEREQSGWYGAATGTGLGQREPDVVALQDVNCNAVARYIEAFRRIGLSHVLHTLERQPQAVPTGVLLASRFPLSLLPDHARECPLEPGILHTRP